MIFVYHVTLQDHLIKALRLFYNIYEISVIVNVRLILPLLLSVKHLAFQLPHTSQITTWITIFTETFCNVSSEISLIKSVNKPVTEERERNTIFSISVYLKFLWYLQQKMFTLDFGHNLVYGNFLKDQFGLIFGRLVYTVRSSSTFSLFVPYYIFPFYFN